MTGASLRRSVARPDPNPGDGLGAARARPRRRWWRRLGAGVVAAVLAAVLAEGCGPAPPPARKAKAIEVVVTRPVTSEVTDYQDFTGRLDAVKTVEIRPRVSGYIKDAPFKEGDEVHQGDLLFQIDPQPYQADLNQAEANLKQAQADYKLQERNANRARRLFAKNVISQEDYDQAMAAWEKAAATVGAMVAARDRAKLYLDYTRVTAPLSGRISRRNVDPGNLVNADTTPLTTIVTDNPMFAYFDVDERTYLDLMEAARRGQGSWFSGLQFPLLMRLANEEQFAHSGTVDFLDNRLNPSTGTIRVRGVFQNRQGILKAGLFVRIRLPIGAAYKALLIPDEALLNDQGRTYVYVVDAQNRVQYRSVHLGQAIQGLRVIKKGLAAGARVIISGMQRVRPKVQVEVKVQAPPRPPQSPLGKLLSFHRPGGGLPTTARAE